MGVVLFVVCLFGRGGDGGDDDEDDENDHEMIRSYANWILRLPQVGTVTLAMRTVRVPR